MEVWSNSLDERSTPTAEVVRRVRELGRSIERESRSVEDGTDLEAVHNLRIGLRTLDSVIPVLYRREGAAHLRALRGEIRALIRQTGPIRDAEVIWHLIAPILERDGISGNPGAAPGMQDWMPNMHGELRKAESEIRTSIETGQFRRIAVLLRAATVVSWNPGAAKADARADSKRRIRAVHQFLTASLERPHDVSSLHRLRIQAKRLRYNVRFFRPLLGGRIRKLAAPARDIQDELGSIRDVTMAIERLAVGPDMLPDRVLIVRRLSDLRARHAQALPAFLRRQLELLDRTPPGRGQ